METGQPCDQCVEWRAVQEYGLDTISHTVNKEPSKFEDFQFSHTIAPLLMWTIRMDSSLQAPVYCLTLPLPPLQGQRLYLAGE